MGTICQGCGEFVKDDGATRCSRGHALLRASAAAVAARPLAAMVNPNWGSISPADFTPPGDRGMKNANRTVIGIFHFTPPASVNVPGTGYNVVCPVQRFVKRSIVAAKVELFRSHPRDVPVIAVIYGIDRVLRLAGDGHHTFVAAMLARAQVELQLVEFGLKFGPSSWESTTYGEFAENPAAMKGTKMKREAQET